MLTAKDAGSDFVLFTLRHPPEVKQRNRGFVTCIPSQQNAQDLHSQPNSEQAPQREGGGGDIMSSTLASALIVLWHCFEMSWCPMLFPGLQRLLLLFSQMHGIVIQGSHHGLMMWRTVESTRLHFESLHHAMDGDPYIDQMLIMDAQKAIAQSLRRVPSQIFAHDLSCLQLWIQLEQQLLKLKFSSNHHSSERGRRVEKACQGWGDGYPRGNTLHSSGSHVIASWKRQRWP